MVSAIVYTPKDPGSISPHRATIFFSLNGITSLRPSPTKTHSWSKHQRLNSHSEPIPKNLSKDNKNLIQIFNCSINIEIDIEINIEIIMKKSKMCMDKNINQYSIFNASTLIWIVPNCIRYLLSSSLQEILAAEKWNKKMSFSTFFKYCFKKISEQHWFIVRDLSDDTVRSCRMVVRNCN